MSLESKLFKGSKAILNSVTLLSLGAGIGYCIHGNFNEAYEFFMASALMYSLSTATNSSKMNKKTKNYRINDCEREYIIDDYEQEF